MGNIEKKLRQLFDYQKFEKEPKLQGVIDEVHSRKPVIRLLTDDELENAAGGMGGGFGGDGEDPQAYGRCSCGAYLKKTDFGYICTDSSCGKMYDKNKKPISAGNDMSGNMTGFNKKGMK
ncbi:MAG: hypothetical protein IJU43_01345 [Lachnospiraceae bacterium]|jgi:hypothetical protein|nr:hypothetical protein [Lachnospiraceae bacterium]